ncbi:ABC transporter permease [Galactobacter caseinivorans]|uniref:ABC transporter permease n=1 Tax=Galactobacter caseinivorans TaxID=2676123 RepID=A0A496PGI7_9MICC|nr:ABC transporter permease [Galactobacter caseinivorans]RKW69596.1 ABC transporter permease [Galactobacter caseinivorans]
MLKFIIKRLGLLLLTLFGLSILLFLWVRALPGGPATAMLGERATPEAIAAINKAYGFDRPILEQYVTYMGKVITGDFGNSTQSQRPVLTQFFNQFPATAELALFAILFAVLIGIPLGYWAAKNYGKWQDNFSVILSLLGVVIPVFFLAFILKWIFAVQLGWLPTSGRQDVGLDATHYTNFFLLDGLITAEFDAGWDAFKHLILPGIALGSIPLAIITRITRAAVLEVQGADYVRTAKAKGMTPSILRDRFILRNAMLPVATTVGLQLGLLFAGAVLTETVFAYQGLGYGIAQAITNADYPVLQAYIMFIAVIYALINLVVDLLYGVIDPRVRVK